MEPIYIIYNNEYIPQWDDPRCTYSSELMWKVIGDVVSSIDYAERNALVKLWVKEYSMNTHKNTFKEMMKVWHEINKAITKQKKDLVKFKDKQNK